MRRDELQAVLCVPVGEKSPLGVVYLERAAGGFTSDDVEDALLLASELADVASRLVRRSTQTLAEQLDAFRARVIDETMERHANCAASAANELDLARVTIYRHQKNRKK